MTRLIVVGGGASGVLVAAAAGRQQGVDEVVVVEREARPGPGLAYGRAAPHHLLNSPAGRMGVLEDDPGGFVRWSAGTSTPQRATDFSPRRLYGDYLARVLAELPGVVVERAEAVDLAADGAGVHVRLGDGRTVDGDAVVLAVGNPPPAVGGTDPWQTGALQRARGRVLLVGTGLTMVDAATSIARADPDTVMTATSRHGLLPRVHLEHAEQPGPGLPTTPADLGALIGAVGQRVRAGAREGRAWQAEIDGIRPQVNLLWSALSRADRIRFVQHVSRRWEVLRHRMSAATAAELLGLRDAGRLEVTGPSGTYDAVIDCTGPRSFPTTGWSRLVDAMLVSGTARPDALALGLDVDPEGRLRSAAGSPAARIVVVGPARRGSMWETTAVPEIRQQATAVAALLAGS